MNQLKHIFGVSANISNRVPLRGPSISRSAGSNGRDPKITKNVFAATSDNDQSSEVKLSVRSYAKLIADYGKEIEARNATTRVNGDAAIGGRKGGFFSKTPFQHLARVSSLVKIKNGRENGGSSLSTESFSRPPINTSRTADGTAENKSSHDEANVLHSVIGTSRWLDDVADKTPYDYRIEKNMAHPLVQRIAKSNSAGNASFSVYLDKNNRRTSFVKNNGNKPGGDKKNVSVTVKPLKKRNNDERGLSTADSGDNNPMLVTLSEESQSASTWKSSPLRHVHLRINGKPAADMKTVTSKVEKLDVVSSAEKIEIRIPVLSDASAEGRLEASNSTINVLISTQGKGVSSSRESLGGISQSEDSGSVNSRPGVARVSTFFISKKQNVEKNWTLDESSKVVPWWTTTESFRRGETLVARARDKNKKNADTMISEVEGTSRRRGDQEVNAAEVKEIAVSDAEKRVKPVVTKPTSPRQRSQSRRKDSPAISKMMVNELQKKSKQQREEPKMRHRVSLGGSKSDAKPEAGSDTKVRSTASNEPKREAPSVAIGTTMPGKSIKPGEPMADKFSKKIPTSLERTVAASREESRNEFEPSEGSDTETNNNLSSANDFSGRIRAKPISEIGNTNADTRGRTDSSKGQVSEHVGSLEIGSKIGTKPQQDISTKSETNEAPQLPRTYGKIELLPSGQSLSKPVKFPKNGRFAPIKPKGIGDSGPGTIEKLANAKNSTITMKPIEKKSDGTLIDYGVTVSTRKKLERKLSEAQSTNEVRRKNITRQEAPVVIATIKEVIPRGSRDVRGSAINQNTEDPEADHNGPDEIRRQTSKARDHCRFVRKKWNKIPRKGTTNAVNESTTPGTPIDTENRNSKDSSESQVVETVSPDKKLLYSVWLRRSKERTDQDPDPTKDPTSRNS